MTDTRTRRSNEQMIADLESKIAALKVRATRRVAKANPAIRHTTAALKSVDKALAESNDGATRKALQEARNTLSACLSLDGVVVASGTQARRTMPVQADVLLKHVQSNPGQRGEQIALALGTDSKTMRPVMQGLIAEKKVKTKGERRGMTYQPA